MRFVSIVTVMALCSSGCGITATVHRWGAPPLEAQIVDSDANNLYVEDDQGRRYRVPRSTVKELDHPGNVAMAVGLGCLALASIMYFGKDDSGRDPDPARRTVAMGYGIPGAILTAWGGYSWLSSRNAASHTGTEQLMPIPGVVPVGMADILLPPGTLPAPQTASTPASLPAPGTPGAFPPSNAPAPAPKP